MTNDFELIRKDGRLLYEYVRGSVLYGLNTKDSDVDTSGVFICTPNELLGMDFMGYQPQISDDRHDNTWFEIGNFTQLLLKSNPTILESLFVPQDKVIGDIHPFMKELIDNRNEFLTKECFNPFYGYAVSQIEKARGLNKKIRLERIQGTMEKLSPFDFIYTFHKQGSTKLKDWLKNHELKQEYCGLVNIPNMHDVYGLYYDWGMHILKENCIIDSLWHGSDTFTNTLTRYLCDRYHRGVSIREIITRFEDGSLKPLGYKGIINEDGTSEEVKLSSVEDKDDIPLVHISYNQSGYSCHCKQYKEFKEWQENRNPIRYKSNLAHNYDSKNMMHCFRMIHMAKEIANGEGLILQRDKDKEFLMNVRNHKYEYEFLLDLLEQEKHAMNTAMENSTIKEKIDTDLVNNILIDIRKKQLCLK